MTAKVRRRMALFGRLPVDTALTVVLDPDDQDQMRPPLAHLGVGNQMRVRGAYRGIADRDTAQPKLTLNAVDRFGDRHEYRFALAEVATVEDVCLPQR